jgi:predicted RNase H-like nuclease (RuvC/YqgF family)
MLAAALFISTAGYGADTNKSVDQTKPSQGTEQFAQAAQDNEDTKSMTDEEQAVVERADFVDRFTALQDWNSELDKQYIQLNQEFSSLKSQLKQNKLERKRIKIDQKDTKRNHKELQREKSLFEKQEKQRKQMDKLHSGN